MPDVVPPMLPGQGELRDGDKGEWVVEFAWAGFRCVAYVEPGHVRLLSSTARSVTNSFPELAVLGERVRGQGMVLDGVVVALDDAGRPSRRPLMRRTSTVAPSDALRARVPVGFVVTDLLWLDGRPLLRRPYRERRALLADLGIAGPPVLVPPSHPASEAAFVMEAAERYGLDGLHLKRVDAAYKSGRRTRDWLRVPLRRTRPVVVGGWMPADRSSGRIGALLLGIPDGPDGPLRYVGRVGVGSNEARREIRGAIRTLNAGVPPFVLDGPGAVPAAVAADARWLVPKIVGEAEYQGWTRGAHLRLPVWGGIVAGEVDPAGWEGTPWRRESGVPGDGPESDSPEDDGPVGDGPVGDGPEGNGPEGDSPEGDSTEGYGLDGGGTGGGGTGGGGAGGGGAEGAVSKRDGTVVWSLPPEPEPVPPAPAPVRAEPALVPSSLNRSLEQHFVYNAFNTIASVMRTDAPRARELLLGLADLSRTADRVGTPAIPLADELDAVRGYLAIEKARFGRRLDHTLTVGEGLGDAVVAPLQILVAVRDAVQQGIEPRPEGGTLLVVVESDGAGGARVEVVDEGHGSTSVVLPATASTSV